MGLFSKMKENFQNYQKQEEIRRAMINKEITADANRPSVRSLPAKQLITSVADDPRLMEPRKKTNKRLRDQLIECIRQGKFSYTEVAVLDTTSSIIGTQLNLLGGDSQDYVWRVYVKVADLTGRVQKELIMTIYESCPSGWASNYWEEKYQNPDQVNVADYPHAYLVHYYLGQLEYYRVLSYDDLANLGSLVPELKVDWDKCIMDDTNRHCWW